MDNFKGSKIEKMIEELKNSNKPIKRYLDVRGNGKKVFETIIPNKKEKGFFKRYESLTQNSLGTLQNEYLDIDDVKGWLEKTSPSKMAKGGKTKEKEPTIVRGFFYDEPYEYEQGGFVGKGEMVWNKITYSQKMDFLYKNFTPEITPRSQELLKGRAWNFLPKNVKIKFEAKYANMEEYAKGGEISKTQKEKLANIMYQMENTSDSWIGQNHGKFVEMQNDYKKQFKKVYGHTNYVDSNKYAIGGGILSKYTITFENSKGQKEYHNTEANSKSEALKVGKFLEKQNNQFSKGGFKAVSVEEKMAKGGKTKEKEPTIVRGFSDDEPYEYGSGGLLSGFNYSIGGL